MSTVKIWTSPVWIEFYRWKLGLHQRWNQCEWTKISCIPSGFNSVPKMVENPKKMTKSGSRLVPRCYKAGPRRSLVNIIPITMVYDTQKLQQSIHGVGKKTNITGGGPHCRWCLPNICPSVPLFGIFPQESLIIMFPMFHGHEMLGIWGCIKWLIFIV